jgi:integrase/recombinase XerC
MSNLILSGDLPPLFKLPVAIDWEHGQNRARNRVPQIRAEDDLSAINAWLATYTRSKQTLASYRKEAIRLMLWAAHERHRSINLRR